MEIYYKTIIFYRYYYIINNFYMEERQVMDSKQMNEIIYDDGYFTTAKPYIMPDYINNIQEIKAPYIDYYNIPTHSEPYNSFIKNPNLGFKKSHITINSVNNFMKGLVLVLANASLFVPIAQIGGNKTKKNKAKKKINNNN